jgi:hypothetical protein
MDMMLQKGDNSFKVASHKKYNINVDVENMLVNISQVSEGVDELAAGKTVAGVSYYNVMGQEMSQANGVTIVVTRYTDGSMSTSKVIK